MNLSKPIILTPDIESRFQNFILIEATSSRLNDHDIFVSGDKVREIYDYLHSKLNDDDSIQSQIILNRISKIGQMMELLSSNDGIILTKFFDRVWRRYAYVSNVGESFLDLKTFLEFFPEYGEDKYALLAQRIDDDDVDSAASTGTEKAESDTEEGDDIPVVATVETSDVEEKEAVEV